MVGVGFGVFVGFGAGVEHDMSSGTRATSPINRRFFARERDELRVIVSP
jgi:hypothetical protein